ncbi:MAG: phospho-N-acetylmuramoyl-pentapeptide-transferase [Candidatus Marinimicrobia bacterium]|nr:phospho-N-acetylmuramoyl-pentapeptide-transferase [Candidatus Neomarinimicrobiota bacterium]
MIYLIHTYFDINILQYVTFRAAGAAITALLISFLLGPKIIRTLQIHQIGEMIRKNGPHTHYLKEGTPTMGGIIMILSIILPSILWSRLDNVYSWIIIISTLFMGFIGFIDDYLKIVKKLSKGLIARYKLIAQVLTGIFVAFMILNYVETPKIFIDHNNDYIQDISDTSISIPFMASNSKSDNAINGFLELPQWLYVILVIVVITATSNAVNLTDGLDGLATGLSAISILAMGIIAYASGRVDFSDYLNILFLKGSDELLVFSFAAIGACLGFLWYNSNPASVFMGDTGSLALGTVLGTLAVLLRKEILLIIIGGLFVLESLSVIIQVVYFRYTKNKYGEGKRFFLMAPIHHHFEVQGLKESKIVIRFWIIGILLALFSLTTFKLQ